MERQPTFTFHDECARQKWLDVTTLAKVANEALADREQTKATKDTDLFQQPSQNSPQSMANFLAAQRVQKDMWESYDDCEYRVLGDQMQTENIDRKEIFQQPSTTCNSETQGYSAKDFDKYPE